LAQKKCILIVDDEMGVRESLKMILKPNYQVHTAADGTEALQFIQKVKIDLVALDLNMPGLSGIDVLQQIKKNDPDIEVIVITAHGTPQNIQDASRYGAGDFVTKPFNVPDLIKSVNRSLEKRNYNLKLKKLNRYNSAASRIYHGKRDTLFLRKYFRHI
jgi:putative two-component system response regulator